MLSLTFKIFSSDNYYVYAYICIYCFLIDGFISGVLNDLENLDVAAKDRKRKQQQLSSDKKCLRQLEKKLASLERRKQELQQTLKLAKQNLVCHCELVNA